MSRTDLEPEDQAAIIAVLEYVITNFRSASPSVVAGNHACEGKVPSYCWAECPSLGFCVLRYILGELQ